MPRMNDIVMPRMTLPARINPFLVGERTITGSSRCFAVLHSMRHSWMALIGLAASVLSAGAFPNADEIVRQSVANTQADWRAAPDYNFTERDVTVKHGSRSVKTYRVRMIDGAPYYELTAMTGGPLSPAQSAEENRKLQMAIEQRQSETSAQRQRRIANYERQRRQDDALMADMAKAFDYSLAGQATVNGPRCFILRATRNPVTSRQAATRKC